MFIRASAPGNRVAPFLPPLTLEILPRVLAIHWRERTIPLARGGNIRGFFPLGEGRGSVGFESLLELSVIRGLVEADDSCDIVSQPLTIHYAIGEEVHKYTPDFLVRFRELPDNLAARGFDRLTLIECKPSEKLVECSSILARANAALKQVTSTPFVVVSDGGLNPVEWEAHSDD